MKDNAYINILKQNGHTISKPISNIDLFDFFIPKIDEQYFYISFWGDEVCYDTRRENEPDDLLFIMTKCLRTEEEAERYFKVIKAKAKIELEILKENDGWKPDWTDLDSQKFYIYHRSSNNNLAINNACGHKYINLDNIFYIKSKTSAQKILRKYKKEFFIIFGATE